MPSWAALRGGGLPKALNYLGMAADVAGLLKADPTLEVLFFVFGPAGIVRLVWMWLVMLRGRASLEKR